MEEREKRCLFTDSILSQKPGSLLGGRSMGRLCRGHLCVCSGNGISLDLCMHFDFQQLL